MKKKLLTKFLTGGLALTMLFGSVACSNADKTYEYTKESDTLYYTNSDNTDLNLFMNVFFHRNMCFD